MNTNEPVTIQHQNSATLNAITMALTQMMTAMILCHVPVFHIERDIADPRTHGHGRVLPAEETTNEHNLRAAGSRPKRRNHPRQVRPLEQQTYLRKHINNTQTS